MPQDKERAYQALACETRLRMLDLLSGRVLCGKALAQLDRDAVLSYLDVTGPRTGLPTLLDQFSDLPVRALEDLLIVYKQAWRRRRRMRILARMNEESLRIAVLTLGSLTHLGGHQVFTYNLLQHLHGRGHAVTLYIAREEWCARRSFYHALPVTVRPLPPRVLLLLGFCPALAGWWLRREQRRRGHHVWQAIGVEPAGTLISRLRGLVPTAARAYGDDIQRAPEIEYGLRLNPAVERRIRRTVADLDRVVAMNESMAACCRELGLPDSRIARIPNGFDLAQLRQPVDRDAVRAELGIPVGTPLLLTVGRYHRKKGYELVPAIARQLAGNTDFAWILLGKGLEVLEPALQAADVVEKVLLREQIGFDRDEAPGRMRIPDDRLVGLYHAADVLVFPSLLEGSPRVVGEAMAAGLPVVTTDAPGCDDVAEGGENALVVPTGDAGAMAQAVRQMLSDNELRQRLRDNAARWIGRCDWPVVVRQYEALYRELIQSAAMTA